jgi:hypothetical protein
VAVTAACPKRAHALLAVLLVLAFPSFKRTRAADSGQNWQFALLNRDEKSRAAILRIGARQEGIVRNERIMPDGRKRNSVRFSIIDTEWPEVRAGLEQKMARTRG